MNANEKEGFFTTTGANIYFETKGKGDSVLFIHAGIADSRMWEREFNLMANHFHVIKFDLPGYGLSEFTGGRFSYNDIIDGLLKHLNIDKVHILAASFGGKVALDFALAKQEEYLSLALAAPALSGWEDSQCLQDYGAIEEKLLEEKNFEEVATYNFDMWVLQNRHHNCVDERIKNLVIDMQMQMLTKAEPDCPCEEIEEEENLTRIKNIEVPVLVIVGEHDVQDFQEMASVICKEVSSSKKIILQDAAHLSNLESPILFEEAVLDFFLNR